MKKAVNKKENNLNIKEESEIASLFGYASLINYEPLAPSDGSCKIIPERRNSLSPALTGRRTRLKKEYKKLIINKGYNLTFYEFLKTKKDRVNPKIITYERENELLAAMLYKAYLESGMKCNFKELASRKGLEDIPMQYINPELYEEEEENPFNVNINNSDDFDVLDAIVNDTLNSVVTEDN